jgi:hypothetical protein
MRACRHVALMALVLASAVVVVASPAFATPRLTTSTGASGSRPDNGAVSPFVTPIGDTLRRSITISETYGLGSGSSSNMRSLAGAEITFTCIRITASAFPDITHTRLKVTSFNTESCRTDQTGTRGDVVSEVSSSRPAFIHLTRVTAGPPRSADGVFEITARRSFSYHIKLGASDICVLTFIPQSMRMRSTTTNRTLEINDPTLRFTLDSAAGGTSCPNPAVLSGLRATTNIRYTEDEASGFRVTDTSNVAESGRS